MKDTVNPKTEFGLEPVVFGGKEGFGELLYSITDSAFLFRNGTVPVTVITDVTIL